MKPKQICNHCRNPIKPTEECMYELGEGLIRGLIPYHVECKPTRITKDTKRCEICSKKITIKKTNDICGLKHESTQGTWDSEEGVSWGAYWFCNICWKKIIKEVKNGRKRSKSLV